LALPREVELAGEHDHHARALCALLERKDGVGGEPSAPVVHIRDPSAYQTRIESVAARAAWRSDASPLPSMEEAQDST
jgi:hypothetical protein